MAEEQKPKKEKKDRGLRKFFREFKEFISRGNVMDMAVGVIIGAAFGKIVTSLTNDILMPLITLAMGKNSLAELAVVLRPAELNEAGEVVKAALTWNWGNFLQTILDFLIIAFVVFLILKALIGLKKVNERAKEGVKQVADKLRDDDEQPAEAPAEAAAEPVEATSEEEKTE